MASIRSVTAKPPKMFTEASVTARKPKNAATPPVPVAIRAPTMITLEIALVTDIRGVCRAGVTDQTT